MIKHNEEACEFIAAKIRNIINNEIFDYFSPPITINDMIEGYEKIIEYLERMK
jgi:hypothetical protein